MANTSSDRQIESVRSFNRFYTRHLGLLEKQLLETPFTLAQARVLYEIATRRSSTASEINETLALDLGYLSRILNDFAARKLITRTPAREDRRRMILQLTAKGQRAFRALDEKSRREVSGTLTSLSANRRTDLMESLGKVRGMLAPHEASAQPRLRIRTHRLGDVGWAIELHARMYAEEYRWNEEFEALVATLFARFATKHDPARERFWVAELAGVRVGCVFVVQNEKDPSIAQLRCLLVAPEGRGHGIGRKLVAQCLQFARQAGYRKMILWTNDVLVSARRIYEAAGFQLVEEEPHHSFGHDLVGQVWELNFREHHRFAKLSIRRAK